MLKRFVLIAICSLGLTTTNFGQAKIEPVGKRTAVIISKIDDSVVNEFQKAWLLAGNGFAKNEAVVLLFQNRDGSLRAKSLGSSGISQQFTFTWAANILAVVHTHANGVHPEPSEQDLRVADRFGIPVFTITPLGMYVYDPETRKTSAVQQGLDWLDSTKWNQNRQPAAQEPLNHRAIRATLERAWYKAGGGTFDHEVVVLVQTRGDDIEARLLPLTNQFAQITFSAGTERLVAIFHTHPNRFPAEPTLADREVADKLHIPVYTCTSRGLYKYDPAVKRTVQVAPGLDWLK